MLLFCTLSLSKNPAGMPVDPALQPCPVAGPGIVLEYRAPKSTGGLLSETLRVFCTWFAQTGAWLPSQVPVPGATPLHVPATCSVSIFCVLVPMLEVLRKLMLPPTSTFAPVICALFA